MAVEVRTYDTLVTVTLPVDTAIHASGDLLSNPVEMPTAALANGSSVIVSASVIDYDDQGANLNLLFFDAYPGNLGALNAAMAISDTQAAMLIGQLSIDSWLDLGAQQLGEQTTPKSLLVRAADGGPSIWVAARSAGTGTYATGHLTLKLGPLRG